MTAERFAILGIAGSLRSGSYNRGLLRAAAGLLPPGVTLEVFDLAPLPLYNEDLLAHPPQPVLDLKARIRAADALLFACPEYNYLISGVLKNALDWASRPPVDSALKGKRAAMFGASTGRMGTVRAQLALRQVLLATGTQVLMRPEVLVTEANRKFDAEGNLTDEATRDILGKLLAGLVEWVRSAGPIH